MRAPFRSLFLLLPLACSPPVATTEATFNFENDALVVKVVPEENEDLVKEVTISASTPVAGTYFFFVSSTPPDLADVTGFNPSTCVAPCDWKSLGRFERAIDVSLAQRLDFSLSSTSRQGTHYFALIRTVGLTPPAPFAVATSVTVERDRGGCDTPEGPTLTSLEP